ncbi:MAG: response regulator [Desulfarculaceae bacterium]|jgi:response regulator of citrate/malate metabolism
MNDSGSGQGLTVVILDDDPMVCEVMAQTVTDFYPWGEVYAFTDFAAARDFCLGNPSGLAIFLLDVFLGDHTAFDFIEAVKDKYPLAPEDTVIVTGHASNDVVDMCMAAGVNYLLEKPVRPYALQMAVRAIASKYLRFAVELRKDPGFALDVERLGALNY